MGNLQTAANAADFARAWQRLRDHFAELFAPGEAALDAVAQLRQTILRLAVQGKLVPRDADDEPVSKLLRQIHEERARLVESGELRDAPPLDQIADKELLFSIPSSWQWVRAGDICQGITSGTTPPQAVFQDSPDSAIPYLKVYNIRNQRVDFEYKPQYIAETYHRSKMKRSTLFPGDVIMNIVGPPLGKVAIIPDSFPEWNCNQAIVFFRLLGQVVPSYLHAYLMEGSYLRNIELIGTAGQDNISVTKSKNIVIPLPPLAEQQRIVAKVQQLMAQCDALEASLKEAATVSERWSAAVVRRFSAIAR
jgi:type I restriction enzyme S subunit